MNKIDSVLLSTIADFLINFSVFWFGVAIVSPIFPGIDKAPTFVLLTSDFIAGIVSLIAAYVLRKALL